MALKVTLASVGNPDFPGQDASRPLPGVENRTVTVVDIPAASKACRDYIEKNDLGGGNWAGGLITDETGAEVGRVSYNGRVWPPGPLRTDSQPIWPPQADEDKKPEDPFKWESAIVEVPGFGTLSITGCLRHATIEARGTFKIDGTRYDFSENIAFDEERLTYPPQRMTFMEDGRYDRDYGIASAEKAVRKAVEAWAEQPENIAMILRNAVKDNRKSALSEETNRIPAYRKQLENSIKARDNFVSEADRIEALIEALASPAPGR